MAQPEPADIYRVESATRSEAETRYREQVGRVFNRISLTGLPERDPRLHELPLDQVFVTLSVEVQQESPSPVYDASTEAVRDVDNPVVPADPRRSERRRPLRPPPPPPPQTLSVAEALQRYRRLVVVGAPGSGKTTLLRWLAVTFAADRQSKPDRLGPAFSEPLLPIVLELRRFTDRLQRLVEQPATFNLAEEASAYLSQDARFAHIPAELIRDKIQSGQCLILLDGLDEIADQATRRRLIEAVEALYLHHDPGLARNVCLLTTRPHGFANLSLGTGFQTATVRPFRREDISGFIRNWYRIAYGQEALAEEASDLIAAIQNNDRVETLASNPLLCTIIAVVYRNNRVLPDRRVELYLKCCEALLDTWERNKDIKSSGLIGGLSWQEKLELLASLAYWMHGETERLAASEDAVVDQIRLTIEGDNLAEPSRAAEEARQFLEAIRDRSGILQGRGDGSLEFSHRTFQEYLAARHLAALGRGDDRRRHAASP
jgi:predicted NACHT family NTPase